MRNTQRLMVAGGGTGGHFYCGLAFAQRFVEKYPQSEVIFVGVRKGIEGRHRFEDKRFKIEFIQAMGAQGMNPMTKIIALISVIVGIFGSLIRIIRYKPRVIIGVGGYASASTMLAAIILKPFMGFKAYVVDQNSVPGMVNRFLAKFLPAYAPFPSSGFKTIELPLRDEVLEKRELMKKTEWPPKTIMVMGGSQGALGLNKAWIKLMGDLRAEFHDLKFIHQTGDGSYENVSAAYNEFGLEAECFAFHKNIAEYLARADLVIARAGALSIFELILFERPSVFVPFPHAAENHQFKNAQAVQHASWIIPENQLNIDNFKRVLSTPEPRIPSLKVKAITSWRSLFHS